MKRIAYSHPDGSVSVVHPCISRDDPIGMTEEQALQRALGKDVPTNAQNVTVLEPSAIPVDRLKRHAWRIQDGAIVVDPLAPEPILVRNARRLEELKAKRRAGLPLAALEQQEIMDLLLGI